MSAKQKALALAQELGVEIVTNGQFGMTITVEAPGGKHWRHGHLHELVSCKNNDPSTPPIMLWQDIYDRMKDGVEECDPASAECQAWLPIEA